MPILNALSIQRAIKTADPILQQAGQIIERQVGQLVRLVDDLLDVARITKGKLRLNKEPVELRAVVNNAVEVARPAFNGASTSFLSPFQRNPFGSMLIPFDWSRSLRIC